MSKVFQPSPAWKPPVDTELAWAAGFLDRSSSMHLVRHRASNNMSVRICAFAKDQEGLSRLASATGVDSVYTRSGQKGRIWVAHGKAAVHHVLSLLWPYLSAGKKRQAKELWTEYRNFRRKKTAVAALPGA